MKYEKYERPDLQLIEIELEGSFLNTPTYNVEKGGEYKPSEGEEEDPW